VEFRVIWEIEIEAEGPKEAAQEARTIRLTPGMSATVFDVSAHAAGKMYRIDLVEEPDRLDRYELFAVKAGLRLLQCNPKTAPSIRELASIILIFLDEDNLMSKRGHR
jgi:molybdopterin-biosynthesis enzyme MoeA-like protein